MQGEIQRGAHGGGALESAMFSLNEHFVGGRGVKKVGRGGGVNLQSQEQSTGPMHDASKTLPLPGSAPGSPVGSCPGC